jgi:hypothetical protein
MRHGKEMDVEDENWKTQAGLSMRVCYMNIELFIRSMAMLIMGHRKVKYSKVASISPPKFHKNNCIAIYLHTIDEQ